MVNTSPVSEPTRLDTNSPIIEQRHQRHHEKRQLAVVTDTVTTIATAIQYVTYEFEDIVVYVDGNNQPVSTSIVYKDLLGTEPASMSPLLLSSTQIAPSSRTPSSMPGPAPISSVVPSLPPQDSSSTVAPPPPSPAITSTQQTQAPAPSPIQQSSAAASPPSSRSGSGSGSSGPGFSSAISYTPYNADNSCKTSQQVATDLEKAASYEVIRLYGTDCNQIANVIAATGGKISLFLGIFDINSIQAEVQTVSSAVSGKWSLVNTVSVGNELVNSGTASASQVTAAIGTAKAALKAAGYSGPVVTVDTMMAMKNNIELCTASDFCAINCHAFFDGNTLPSGAGPFVKEWAQQISEAAGGKTTVVTESGWPTQGDTNDKAVPSQENHEAAIESLKSSFGGGTNLVLYGMVGYV